MQVHFFRRLYESLRTYEAYSFITITGLGFGVIGCMGLLVYLRHAAVVAVPVPEVPVEAVAETPPRSVYLLAPGEAGTELDGAPAFVAPALERCCDEVLHALRLFQPNHPPHLRVARTAADDQRFYFSDPAYFEVFNVGLLLGDPATALRLPGSVVLTETAARRYFGTEDPIGRRLVFDEHYAFTVTGVMEDPPHDAPNCADFLASMASLPDVMGWPVLPVLEDQSFGTFCTFIVLKDGYGSSDLEQKLDGFVSRYLGSDSRVRFRVKPVQVAV
jgi:putative ABC transport system permease protein